MILQPESRHRPAVRPSGSFAKTVDASFAETVDPSLYLALCGESQRPTNFNFLTPTRVLVPRACRLPPPCSSAVRRPGGCDDTVAYRFGNVPAFAPISPRSPPHAGPTSPSPHRLNQHCSPFTVSPSLAPGSKTATFPTVDRPQPTPRLHQGCGYTVGGGSPDCVATMLDFTQVRSVVTHLPPPRPPSPKPHAASPWPCAILAQCCFRPR